MTQPVDTNDTEDGRARNRRVELQALGADDGSDGKSGAAGG